MYESNTDSVQPAPEEDNALMGRATRNWIGAVVVIVGVALCAFCCVCYKPNQAQRIGAQARQAALAGKHTNIMVPCSQIETFSEAKHGGEICRSVRAPCARAGEGRTTRPFACLTAFLFAVSAWGRSSQSRRPLPRSSRCDVRTCSTGRACTSGSTRARTARFASTTTARATACYPVTARLRPVTGTLPLPESLPPPSRPWTTRRAHPRRRSRWLRWCLCRLSDRRF